VSAWEKPRPRIVAGEDQGHEPKRTTGLLDYAFFPLFPKARSHVELKKKGGALLALPCPKLIVSPLVPRFSSCTDASAVFFAAAPSDRLQGRHAR
jgi:hypothetical protein